MERFEVKNKWNGNLYVVKYTDDEAGVVHLIRDDDTEFSIKYSDYVFNYRRI